ncbi:MAG: hypothetical protein QOG53_1396 [Frankiales bacterium]|nr:hypothetical protein [Frankiales bacterium]
MAERLLREAISAIPNVQDRAVAEAMFAARPEYHGLVTVAARRDKLNELMPGVGNDYYKDHRVRVLKLVASLLMQEPGPEPPVPPDVDPIFELAAPLAHCVASLSATLDVVSAKRKLNVDDLDDQLLSMMRGAFDAKVFWPSLYDIARLIGLRVHFRHALSDVADRPSPVLANVAETLDAWELPFRGQEEDWLTYLHSILVVRDLDLFKNKLLARSNGLLIVETWNEYLGRVTSGADCAHPDRLVFCRLIEDLAQLSASPKECQEAYERMLESAWAGFLGPLGYMWVQYYRLPFETLAARLHRLMKGLPGYPYATKHWWLDQMSSAESAVRRLAHPGKFEDAEVAAYMRATVWRLPSQHLEFLSQPLRPERALQVQRQP